VPGTHDVGLGLALLDQLVGGVGSVAMPRFDKARDERLDAAAWPEVEVPVDVVLLEGWCVGAPPQEPTALLEPCNELEREEDAQGDWRRAVNDALMGDYATLFGRMDALVYLRIPDFEAALRWREEQEAELRRRAVGAMTPTDVLRFVAHYQRLTVAFRQAAPGRADLLLDLDRQHRLVAVVSGGGWRRRRFRRHSAL